MSKCVVSTTSNPNLPTEGLDLSDDKLRELLSVRYESEELDYKIEYHHEDLKSTIELAKDVAAMANTRGGYIIIGVRDQDFAAVGLPPAFHMDSAELQAKIARYFRPVPKFIYAEKTVKVDETNLKLAMIGIEPSEDVVIATTEENYQDKKGAQQSVFSSGTILVRKGTESGKADPDTLRALLERTATRKAARLSKGSTGLFGEAYRPGQLNNLQRPDYQEFIGRESYIADILTKLGQRFFVVSIDGIGGVGKTALAQEIAFRCLQQKAFDAIIWISAKHRALQLTGIKDIVPALTNYEDLLNTTLDVFGFGPTREDPVATKEAKVKELLARARCLLVIDNLEAVEDERIFNLLKDLPDPSKALITSRRRLGEVERIVHLKEMTLDECTELITQDAKAKSVSEILASPERAVKMIYEATGGIPLAIRWVEGWAGQGGDLGSVCRKLTERTSSVLEFCFNEIYQSVLGRDARRILSLMPIFESAPDKSQIEAASSIQGDHLEAAIEQLVALSLLNEELERDPQGELLKKYGVLPLTLSFAQAKLSEDRGLEIGARKGLGLYLSKRKKESEAIVQYGYALRDVGATTERGRVAALQAQLGFAAYQRGNYSDSNKLFQQAVESDPNLSFTYQLWATVERQEGHVGRAEELFREAARLNPGNVVIQRAWAMMKKDVGDLEGARTLLSEALANKPTDVPTIHSLAVLESQKGNHDVADALFRKALIEKPTTYEQRRQNVYTYGAMAENNRKWGESEERKPNLSSAHQKFRSGLESISKGLELAPQEWRLINNRIRLNRSLGRLLSKMGDPEGAEEMLRRAMYMSPRRPRELQHNSDVCYSLAINYEKLGRLDEAIQACTDSLRYFDNPRALSLRTSLMRRPRTTFRR